MSSRCKKEHGVQQKSYKLSPNVSSVAFDGTLHFGSSSTCTYFLINIMLFVATGKRASSIKLMHQSLSKYFG